MFDRGHDWLCRWCCKACRKELDRRWTSFWRRLLWMSTIVAMTTIAFNDSDYDRIYETSISYCPKSKWNSELIERLIFRIYSSLWKTEMTWETKFSTSWTGPTRIPSLGTLNYKQRDFYDNCRYRPSVRSFCPRNKFFKIWGVCGSLCWSCTSYRDASNSYQWRHSVFWLLQTKFCRRCACAPSWLCCNFFGQHLHSRTQHRDRQKEWQTDTVIDVLAVTSKSSTYWFSWNAADG
jgi:hypothetical protein